MEAPQQFDEFPVFAETDEKSKPMVPARYFEGFEEIKTDEGTRPAGQSKDPDNVYWWKMSRDKKTIDVIFPIPDEVTQDRIIYRLGEEPTDPKRGPTIEMGWKYRTETGRFREHLVLDGHILNNIQMSDNVWVIEEMAGVRVCVLTVSRPTMMRQRHDPIMQQQIPEVRIEVQTWDVFLLEEREFPEITDTVYFDISLDDEPAGRVEFGLYGNVLPKTVKNFIGLATGEYTDDEGNKAMSALCFKGTTFQQVMPDFIIAAGNAGISNVTLNFTPSELKEYMEVFGDFSKPPVAVGQVEKNWCIRWGADLGRPLDEEGRKKAEGGAVDGNNETELKIITDKLKELDEKGEGGQFIFFRPEYEKGCDMTGKTFPAEGFHVPHTKRGMLSMDRDEKRDLQGSAFFVTLKEFPEMDKRWSCFGEVTKGMDLIEKIEVDYDGEGEAVTIEDCGLVV